MAENLMWMKRPNLNEEDEDLMYLGKQFSGRQFKPSAQLVKKQKTESCQPANDESVPITLSDFTSPSEILLDVMERDVVEIDFTFPADMQSKYPPRKFTYINPCSKKSAFLQQMEELKLKETTLLEPISLITDKNVVPQCFQSCIVDGSGLGMEHDEIRNLHEENLQKISSMSSEEIQKHQKELLSTLSDDTIQFLRSKRKNMISKTPVQLQSTTRKCTLSNDPMEITLKNLGEQNRDAIILEDIAANFPEPNLGKEKSEMQTLPEEMDLDDLPINPNDAGHWMHMDTVEKDKLAWMTTLPKPKPLDNKTGHTARFDFEGNLLSRTLDIPTQMGLHHHSDEPEVAGYSIEELFILARSSTQAQRTASLQTLAAILENYWDGRFDGCFNNSSLVETLLQSGLVPILRWVLDDNNLSALSATVLALHRLLICKSDELCLDRAFCWLRGHLTPFLVSRNKDPDINIEELTDANLVKMDVITGLLRMDILPRFRWILWKLCPPSSVCELIIEICIRIARHSMQSAKQVVEFLYLLTTIFKKFLPTSYGFNRKSTNTADVVFPLPIAVKLLRVITASSRSCAEYLMTHHNVFDVLECYLTIDPSDGKLVPADVQKLMVQSLMLWQTLLSYGFCTDIYVHLLPVLRRQFVFCLSLSINTDIEKNIANYEYAAHFFKACEMAVAAISDYSAEGKRDILKQTCLTSWEDVFPLAEMGLTCAKRWLYEFSVQPTNWSGQNALVSCLNFVSSIFDKSAGKDLSCCELLIGFEDNLLRFLNSVAFSHLVENLSRSSALLCEGSSGCKRDAEGLVSLGNILWEGDVLPLLSDSSSVPLVLSVLHFVNVIIRNNHSVYSLLVENVPEALFENYLTNIANSKVQSSSYWCIRFEIDLLMNVAKLLKIKKGHNSDLLFKISLVAIKFISTPFEVMLSFFFEKIILESEYFRNKPITQLQLLSLPYILKVYESTYFPLQNVQSSITLHKPDVTVVKALSYEILTNLVTSMWIFRPLYDLYKVATSKMKKAPISQSSDILLDLKSILVWLNILHAVAPISSTFKISINEQFIYLCLIFLNDIDAYRNEEIRNELYTILKNLLNSEEPLNLVNAKSNDGFSFEEIFIEMLTEFEATSYGDSLFSNFIVVPLQQRYPSQWKLQLLADHEQVLNCLNVSLKELLIPIENFLEPHETNEALLEKYFKLLASQTINNLRCPLFYLMGIHHVHHFISSSTCTNVQFQTILRNSVSRIDNKEIRSHILHYVKYDLNTKLGFILKDS